jgi:DNA-binding MarR family transcriptional regulator
MKHPSAPFRPSPILAERPGLLLRGAARHFSCGFTHVLERLGIKTQHLVVLQILSEEEHPTQARVGMRLRMDRTTMVKTIDDLERLGLAVRTDNPRDRRAYGLELTAKGRRTLFRGMREVRRAEDVFFHPLTPAERRLLKGLLFRLIYAAGQASDGQNG